MAINRNMFPTLISLKNKTCNKEHEMKNKKKQETGN